MNRGCSLQIRTFVNQPFGANTYVLTRPFNSSSIVIDPGEWDGTRTVQSIAESGGQVEYVVLTHEHFDHVGGLQAFKDHWDCQVICSRLCSENVVLSTGNLSRYLVRRDVAVPPADHCCEDSDWALEWEGMHVRFFPTPGHTPGSICIALEGILFTGDTLLPDGRRAANLPGGNKRALERSLSSIVRMFSPETLVYPGHGKPFLLECAQAVALAEAHGA